jgi:hypothetical protein
MLSSGFLRLFAFDSNIDRIKLLRLRADVAEHVRPLRLQADGIRNGSCSYFDSTVFILNSVTNSSRGSGDQNSHTFHAVNLQPATDSVMSADFVMESVHVIAVHAEKAPPRQARQK